MMFPRDGDRRNRDTTDEIDLCLSFCLSFCPSISIINLQPCLEKKKKLSSARNQNQLRAFMMFSLITVIQPIRLLFVYRFVWTDYRWRLVGYEFPLLTPRRSGFHEFGACFIGYFDLPVYCSRAIDNRHINYPEPAKFKSITCPPKIQAFIRPLIRGEKGILGGRPIWWLPH